MKHVIFGGDGFVGRYLARDLMRAGDEVVVCDIKKTDLPIYPNARFEHVDIRDRAQVDKVDIGADDVVYNLAAHLLLPIMPRAKRDAHFFPVILDGTNHILDRMERAGCTKLVQFSTDMVYGIPDATPVPPTAPRGNLQGPYAESKKACEDACIARRAKGLDVTIFRPRMIIGPGRLGLLESLFKLVDKNLPVPLIGPGKNRYQMISVFDCADAAFRAAKRGCPNGEHNLGSDNPPRVDELLRALIKHAGSRSFLVKTPAPLMRVVLDACDRVGIHLLVPEQFKVADIDYVVDNTSTKETFGWRPRYGDADMIIQAYEDYRHPVKEGMTNTARAA